MAYQHWTIERNITSINYNHLQFIHFELSPSIQLALVSLVRNRIIRSHYEKVIAFFQWQTWRLYQFIFFFIYLVPDGVPIGFRTVKKTSSSLSLEWYPPPRNTIHGEFIGYRLRYHKNANSASLLVLHEREITIGDPEAKVSFNIRLFK